MFLTVTETVVFVEPTRGNSI